MYTITNACTFLSCSIPRKVVGFRSIPTLLVASASSETSPCAMGFRAVAFRTVSFIFLTNWGLRSFSSSRGDQVPPTSTREPFLAVSFSISISKSCMDVDPPISDLTLERSKLLVELFATICPAILEVLLVLFSEQFSSSSGVTLTLNCAWSLSKLSKLSIDLVLDFASLDLMYWSCASSLLCMSMLSWWVDWAGIGLKSCSLRTVIKCVCN